MLGQAFMIAALSAVLNLPFHKVSTPATDSLPSFPLGGVSVISDKPTQTTVPMLLQSGNEQVVEITFIEPSDATCVVIYGSLEDGYGVVSDPMKAAANVQTVFELQVPPGLKITGQILVGCKTDDGKFLFSERYELSSGI
jgi:hypothetical protein